jgi:hypothetical protein
MAAEDIFYSVYFTQDKERKKKKKEKGIKNIR